MGLLRFQSRVFVVVLLFLIPLGLFGVEDFKKLCNEETFKNEINRELVFKYCTKVGDQAIKEKKFGSASLYYLFAGNFNKNIEYKLQKKIDDGFLLYIGHSYLLKGNLKKTKEMYKIFLRNAKIPWADKIMQNSFKVLFKIYPKQKNSLKKGIKIWNQIYKPLKSVNTLYKEYEKAKKEKKYKEAINYLEAIVILQEKHHHNNKDLSINYSDIGIAYYNIKKFSKALNYFYKTLNIEENLLVKNHLEIASTYTNIGLVYQDMKNFSKALEFVSKALDIREKVLGKNHLDTANTYTHMGLIYQDMGMFSKALEFYYKDLNVTEKNLGRNHLDTAYIYNNIGSAYKYMGEFSKALEFFYKDLNITEKTLGKNNLKTAISYNNIALVYHDMGKLQEALKFQNKALKIKKNILDNNHLSIATSYGNISLIYNDLNSFKKALYFSKKALNITENILGENHLSTATSYNNIGLIYSDMGYFQKSLQFYTKSLHIREDILGKYHSVTAVSYSNLGSLYQTMGNFSKALVFYTQALNIARKSTGFNPNIPIYYANLGSFYKAMGAYPKALKNYIKALNISENILGKNHLITATYYEQVGFVYFSMKKLKKALIFSAEALHIRENILGKENPSLISSYNYIGIILLAMKKFPKALEFSRKALSISKNIPNRNHINVGATYNNIALVYDGMKKFPKALEFYTKSLKISENILGKGHYSTAVVHHNIGEVYYAMKDYYNAYNSQYKSFKISIKNRDKNFLILNSIEKEKYIKANTYVIYPLLQSAIKYYHKLQKDKSQFKAKKIKNKTFYNWINYKGTLFEYPNIITLIDQTTKNKKLKRNIKNLKYLILHLANLKKKKISNKKIKEEITETKNKISKLEISLNNSSIKIKELFGLKDIKATTISSKLKVNQLYIDFVRTSENYYIFTLNKNNQINFIQMDKEDSKSLDENIKKLKLNNKKMAQATDNKTIEQKREKLKKESQAIFSKLYTTLISKYLAKELKDKESLIISPDGLLNSLPFEALYHNGRYLIQDYQISYISSGREFVRQTKREKAEPKYKMICFGDPDFNTTLPIDVKVIRTLGKLGKQDRTKKLDTWEQYTSFSPLGNAEIEMIRELYKSDTLIYEGKRATVNNLMSIKSPKILHLSTHGKFLDNPNILNPMLRAGLAFSGANKSLDGIVTALKLSALDLKDTELVVLSACESGLGKIQNAEGVVGLPKAFLQAGARNVVMSLWSVSNWETTQLMKYFYENINKGQTYSTALRNAKIKMIDMHPYYWSAFIIHGIQN